MYQGKKSILNESSKKYREIWIPACICILLFMFKIVFIIDNRTMPQVSDEFLYARFSNALLTNHTYASVQYPILYPIALMPAYFFENYYVAMKVINAFWSSLVPFMVYKILRLYVGEKESIIGAVFSAIVPFQYISTMTLMSENLYFFLFLLAIYLVLKEYRNVILGDVLIGALLGLMFLTRHVTLVIIPVFAFVWFMKQINNKVKFVNIILRGLLVCIVLGVVYSPWVVMCHNNGYTFKQTIGFKIASNSNPEQLTIERLIMTAGFYLAYFVLISAPVLGVLVKALRGLDFKITKICSKYNQISVLVFGLAAAFFTAVTRHSWRAYYNYPNFEKIKGRYLIYFPTLFVILAIVVLFEKKVKFKNKYLNICLTYILPILAIVGSYLADIKGVFYTLGSTFIGSIESVDGQKIKLVGFSFVILVSVFICFYQYVYDFGKENVKRYFYVIFVVAILTVEVYGMPQYLKFVNEVNAKQNATNNAQADEFIGVIDEIIKSSSTNDKIYILVDELSEYKFILRTLIFRLYDNVVISKDIADIKTNEFYYVTDDEQEYNEYLLEDVATFQWNEAKYYMKYLKMN